MPHKNAYEPKDARIMSYYEDDEVDDEIAELSASNSRKKKTTGTQALAEFLSTTSPEEFQRNSHQHQQQALTASSSNSPPTEPSSTNFFKLRKSKRSLISRNESNDFVDSSIVSSTTTLTNPASMSTFSSIQSAPSTVHRKNYIEIVPKVPPTPSQQQQQQQYSSGSDFIPRGDHPSSPMLPQMGQHKKRDSSLYSGSLRHSASIRSQLSGMGGTTGRMVGRSLIRQDTTTTLSTMASGHTTHSNWKQYPFVMTTKNNTNNNNNHNQQRTLTQSLLSTMSKMDVIEAGLVQRLERCRLSDTEKPSDIVAQSLVEEHVRALDVSFQQQEYSPTNEKSTKKARHAQVQTIPVIIDDDSSPILEQNVQSSTTLEKETTQQQQHTTVEQLEKQLAEEKKHRQRLQASLNDTRDHFEVLSGLAYKKLREIWEEKLRWENACMELNQQLLLVQQQQQQQQPEQQHHQQANSDDLVSMVDTENHLSLSVVS
ncbi:uncharacterized protein BX664DRAFT_343688 [Halteromyces radiatus]|uniref:uncharacterized protein n=1 Tax=Halteromyces radiatus TaxID=101107 RepID=UPI00221FB15B|nr:uncharacterized protein BX664DRAFT_343688 [Halteromyces radiatus]KAI8077858.1 hypothetical protein BX664DRAFT_343688 [Halteromyces radiatus]